jgi:hypothetical protein
VPPLHILRAHNAQEYRFYELTGDLPDALHFRHFLGAAVEAEGGGRIRLGEAVAAEDSNPARGRLVLRDE